MRLAGVLALGGLLASGVSALADPTPPPTLGVPNMNPKPPSTGPVQVESCALRLHGNELAAKTGTIEVQFTNEGAVEADLVRFRFDWGSDSTAYVRDVGKFTPGITVTHRFRQSAGEFVSPIFGKPKVRCSVESVHFSDGSVWTNPDEGPQKSTGTDLIKP